MKCEYNQEGICVNDECPAYDRECPVQELTGLCTHEELEEEEFILTPKGCASAAFGVAGLNGNRFDAFWDEFVRLMEQGGLIKEG